MKIRKCLLQEDQGMNEQYFYIRIAEEKDAQKIHNLMVEVYEQLENKSLYVCDDLAFVKRHISHEGFTVVACTKEDKIVGSLILRIPDEEDNLGKDIGFSEEKCQSVIHVESAVVAPLYRGNALQRRMLQIAEVMIDRVKYSYLMATVSPENPASYKTLESLSYELIVTKEKYDGLMRRIYRKVLS